MEERPGASHCENGNELTEELAKRTGTQAKDWFLVFKARYGMQLIFDCLREVFGQGSVSTQLYTCCTAVDPILAAQMTPVYVDVQADTMMIHPQELALDEATRAVMMQHTFGLIDDESSRALVQQVRKYPQTVIVEDSAHCATRMARDGQGSPLADVSVHSFGVEKILPTRFGGAIWVNPELAQSLPQVHALLRSRLANLPRPGKRLDFLTRIYVNQNRVLARLPGSMGGNMRAWLAKSGLYEAPIARSERRGGLAYQPMAPTAWIESSVLKALHLLEVNEGMRANNVKLFRESLSTSEQVTIPQGVMRGEPQPLLRFPIYAASTQQAERVIAAIKAVGVYAERWYRPELFPGVENPADYHVPLDRSHLTVTDAMVAGAISLPTDLNQDQISAVINVINRQQ
jgi:dTDP-4-amino-4,6-dideoxygalactose transaminase